MTVFVSETKPCKFRKYREYAYLIADTEDELHAYAAQIGLSRSWYQDKSKWKHYDLFGSMIDKARSSGATAITAREWIRRNVGDRDDAARQALEESR